MIISASRRTDIPAYYTEWFMNRITEGYCLVPNPMNPKQISRVLLLPEDVDAIVFWSKWPKPLIGSLDELTNRGFHYYFQITLNSYPRELEPNIPDVEKRLDVFRQLSQKLCPARVVWRYDPIIVSNKTPVSFHVENFHRLAESLKGHTGRVMFSFQVYDYKKVGPRLKPLEQSGWEFDREFAKKPEEIRNLLSKMKKKADDAGLEMFSCATPEDLSDIGINHGACIDGDLIEKLFSVSVSKRKDPGQRKACRCIVGRDIGVYHTCLAGCPYCYATSDQSRAVKRQKEHNPDSPALWMSWQRS